MEWINERFNLWKYGKIAGKSIWTARRHKIFRNVQFILWKAGQQGHKKDYWTNYDKYWWEFFRVELPK